MTRAEWVKHLAPYLQPVSDPELAAAGVLEPKPDVELTFMLPYLSVHAFSGGYLNVSDDACLRILSGQPDDFVINTIAWGHLGCVSVQLQMPSRDDAEMQARKIILGP